MRFPGLYTVLALIVRHMGLFDEDGHLQGGKTRKLPRDHLTKVRSLRPVIIPLAEKFELQSPLQINQCYTTGNDH